MGSSVFVENNYFRNTNKPIMISMQGTDIISGAGTFSGETGGMIKAYGNIFAEQSSSFKFVSYQDDNIEFDAYVAASRDEQVPATVKTKSGATSYNNFDTDASRIYTYTPDAAEAVDSLFLRQLNIKIFADDFCNPLPAPDRVALPADSLGTAAPAAADAR